MVSRREFLTKSFGGLSALGLSPNEGKGNNLKPNLAKSRRPGFEQRKFSSQEIENKIDEMKQLIKDPDLARLFENCFPNTLDTTVQYNKSREFPDTFVITGDIPAMWLRDSTAQVWPYIDFANNDEELQSLLKGVIRRQTQCVMIDPFANAFNAGPTGGEWQGDRTQMKLDLHERKWEVDSLCYTIRLAYGYWRQTGDETVFDDIWQAAMRKVVETFRDQQRLVDRGSYYFQRKTYVATDTLGLGGYGNPIRANGLICSSFRPSDDASIYPFLISANFFAVSSLRQLAEITRVCKGDQEFSLECENFALEIERALHVYAISDHPEFGEIIAYEVDGYGNKLLMDDANIPSLLSLPYLGCLSNDDPLYINTRNFIFSNWNPYFFEGQAGQGIGSPHTGIGRIWPLSIIMQALTSNSEQEVLSCLRSLKNSHGGKWFMHESFWKDDSTNYSRDWFAWANSLFGELIIKIERDFPEILALRQI